MREVNLMIWILAVIILSALQTWATLDSVRSLNFILGTSVNLTCSNKTWSEMMYVIWKIKLEHKECRISIKNAGNMTDTCNDGKSLRNTSASQSYLNIPNFSNDDVGVYKCEAAVMGTTETNTIKVAAIVPPRISAWLEWKDDKMVAVCRAEGGEPAANISWSHMVNFTSVVRRISSDRLVTVESVLNLPANTNTENLTCTIRHPYWKKDMVLELAPEKGRYLTLLYSLIVVIIITCLAGFFLFMNKTKIMLRCCSQADPALSSPVKSQPIEDVGEVEPYASYVQRVNSIYNSWDAHSHMERCLPDIAHP